MTQEYRDSVTKTRNSGLAERIDALAITMKSETEKNTAIYITIFGKFTLLLYGHDFHSFILLITLQTALAKVANENFIHFFCFWQ